MSRPTEIREAVEDRFDLPSSICSLRPRPLLVEGFLRRFFGQHFADPDNIEDPALRHLTWVDNTASNAYNPATNILIESSLRYVQDATDLRPAIILHRGDWSRFPVGLNDGLLMGENGPGTNDTRSHFFRGNHTLHCIAPGAMAEILGAEVYRLVGQFAPVLRKLPHFKMFRLEGIGSPRALAKSLKEFVVPVTVSYAFEDTFELIPHLPKIKRLQIDYDIQCP